MTVAILKLFLHFIDNKHQEKVRPRQGNKLLQFSQFMGARPVKTMNEYHEITVTSFSRNSASMVDNSG
jgi:hypothetical protein